MAVTLTKTVNMTLYTAPFLGCVSLCFSDESLSVASSTISDNDSERKAAPVDVKRDSNFKETSTLASSLVSTPPSPPETTERPLFFGPTPHFTDREHEYLEPQRLSNGFQDEAGSMTFVTGDQKSSQTFGTEIVEIDTKAIEQARPTGAATIEPTDPDKATNTEHFEDKRRIQSVLERLLGKSGSELSPPTPYTNSTSGPQTGFSSWNRTLGFILELSSVTFSVSTGEAYTTASTNLQPLITEGGTVGSDKKGGDKTESVASEGNEELHTTIVISGDIPSKTVPFSLYPSATTPNQETNKQQTDQSHSTEGEISSEFFEFPKSASLFSEYRPLDFVGSSEAARTTNSPWKHRAPGNSEGLGSSFTNSLISSFFTVTVVTPTQGESSEPGAGSEYGAGSEHGAESESTRSQSPEAEDTNVFSLTSPESTEGPLPGTFSLAIQNPRTSSSTTKSETSAQTTESDTKPGENVSVFLPVSETTSSLSNGSNSLTTQTGSTDTQNGTNNAKNGTTQGTLIYITSGTSNTSAPFTFPHISPTKASTRNSTSTSPETSPNTASALLLPPRTRPPIKTQAGSVSGSAAQNQPWYRSLYIVVLGVVL